LGATFRFSSELVSFEDKTEVGGKIEALVRDRVSGEEYTVATRYLVGADGARSRVLELAGIVPDGRQLNTAFNVHIKADLSKYISHRPGSLNWVLNPDAPDWSSVGNFRMVRPWTEWVVSMHPSLRDGHTFEPTTADILKRLHQLIGDDGEEDQVSIEILSAFRWTINDQVAPTWQKGNVLCIGDAVHRHPPINGLGSNTCIGDAFNLSWKLAFVLKGTASPAILDTLTIERKPVGDAVVRRANAGMRDHRALWDLLGLSKEQREASTSLMEQSTVEGAELRARVRAAMDKTDDEVNALGIQMNQVYIHSPLSRPDADEVDPPPDFAHLDPLKDVFVSTFPGYHLPHVWIAKDGQSPRISTLDLVGKGAFTLLTGIGGQAWKNAAARLAARNTNEQLLLRVFSIGFRQDYLDVYGDWTKVRGVADDGVVLIRPDHFVAWRRQSMVQDPETKLAEVLSSILGVPL
jgi:2-polyprenyl-6-methoxyphenol hydroxylase-like FAD-dependent oxidoreductase